MEALKAVKNFVARVLPLHQEQMVTELIAAPSEVYEIDGEEGRIVLRGSTVSALTAALGHYLKADAKVHLSWCGCRVKLPEKLPAPQKYRREIRQKYRSYLNYCTFNYSASWWNWERWEKELDFMALNGINLPLSAVGIECVWYDTLLELGYSEEETLAFFSGPAFLAWQWMTNIEGFCGPIPKSWIEKRRILGQQIIQRQLELGMTPMQQGFSGFVPRSLKEKMPQLNIQIEEPWCGIDATAQLDPTEPAFQTIGQIFLEKQKSLFGAHGFYAADPFHEGKPPQEGEEYLHAVGTAIFQLLQDFDPKAVWVMQSWSIRKPIACMVPKERLLILDLAGEGHKKHDNFWGYPFVTGNLHNFGGRTALHGDLESLAENRYDQICRSAPNVCGSGLFMEGIGQNPVYYDLAFDMLTADRPQDLTVWLEEYIIRRYGDRCPEWSEAWEILLKTAYAPGTNGVEKSSIFCARPAVHIKKSGPNDGFHVSYGNRRLLRAVELLLSRPSESDGYIYDIADCTRQLLSNYGQKLYRLVAEAFLNREEKEFEQYSNAFLELLSDVDRLLLNRPEFSLEKWITEARSWGETVAESDYMEYCAGVLITIWGGEEEPHIFDYAWREWSGMLEGFYRKRWEIFFAELKKVIQSGEEYTEDTLPLIYGRETFRANKIYNQIAECEIAWLHSRKVFQDRKVNTLYQAQSLIEKYQQCI